MGQVRILLVEGVDTVCEGHDAGVAVGGLEGGELDASHEEFLHLHGVVLMHLLGDDLAHSLLHGLVVDVGVILAQSFLIFAFLLGFCLCFLFFQKVVFNYSHRFVVFFYFIVFFFVDISFLLFFLRAV